MRQPIFDGKTDPLITIDEGFRIPIFQRNVEYHVTDHSDRRIRKRDTYAPLEFDVNLRIWNDYNRIPLEDVMVRVNDWLYSDGPKKFKIPNTNYYFLGEFSGGLDIDENMIAIDEVSVTFMSEYSHKFFEGERKQSGKSITVSSKTQKPTIPLIKLSGLTGNDVQISLTRAGKLIGRIRLSGTLQSNITIDIEGERIFETNSGVDLIHLLRFDSDFENIAIQDKDIIVVNNGTAQITYKELLL